MPRFVRPSGISARTSRSRGVIVASALSPERGRSRGPTTRGAGAGPADGGVGRGPAGGDARQRVEEVVDVQDPILEQVAEAAGGHEVDRVAGVSPFGGDREARLRGRGWDARPA